MKRFLLYLLTVVSIVACSEGEPADNGSDDGGGNTPTTPTITLNKSSVSFDELADEESISFSTTADWIAEIVNDRADGWLSVTPQSGSAGDASITIKAKENDTPDERNASVRIKAGSASKTISVSQKQKDALTVTASKFEVGAEGGEVKIEVKANIDFEYAIDESAKEWIKYEGTRAMKTSTLTFSVAENDDTEKREGKIAIKSGEFNEVVTIYQAGSEPSIVISQNEYVVSSDGETISVEVSSNVDVEVEMPTDADWISENTTRATSTNTYRFNIQPNEDYDQRSAEIKFTNKENNLSEVVKVTQVQKDALVVAKDNYTVESDGGQIQIEVGHNVDFDIEISNDWITKVDTRAFVTETLNFNIAKNPTTDNREGAIIFKSKDGKLSQTVKVSQVQKDVIVIAESEYTYNVDGGDLELDVNTNVDINVSISESAKAWITHIETRTLHNKKLYFKIAACGYDEERSGVITLQGGNVKQDIVIIQKKYIPSNQIWYTSSTGTAITLNPASSTIYNANIISNIYENGRGIITFDQDVKTIGNYAFEGYHSLTSISLPSSIQIIGEGVFKNCENLKTIDIPETVYEIGWKAFENCTSLVKIKLPIQLTQIGFRTFMGCKSLEEVIIPNTVKEIGMYAFYDCHSLKNVHISNSVTTIGQHSFYGCKSLVNIDIPDSVRSIGEYAFAYCSSLEIVIIGKNVATIGASAFSECNSVKAFYGNFASEDNYALINADQILYFAKGANLTQYTVPKNITIIGASVFSGCKTLENVVLPSGLTKINGGSFSSCTSLKNIDIPNSVVYIGSSVFYNCTSLENVVIPDNVKEIGDYVYSGCTSLKSVIISDNIFRIGERMFYNCTSLSSIVIGENVSIIGYYAFTNCPLKDVYCRPTTPPTASDFYIFGADVNNVSLKIYVPTESVDAYKASSKWGRYESLIIGYDFK